MKDVKADVANLRRQLDLLRDENEYLKAILTAKPIEKTAGAYLWEVPAHWSPEDFTGATGVWKDYWEGCGLDAPSVFPLYGIRIQRVSYEGFGLFVIRVHDDTPIESAEQIAKTWDSVWRKTSTPHVPMAVLAESVDMRKLSAKHLHSMGLMRVPDEPDAVNG
jgi:hypothetical protein